MLTALAVLTATFVALTVSPGAARADWAHDQCSYAQPYETTSEPEEWLEPVGKIYRYGSPDREVNDTIQISESVTSHTTQDFGVSLGFSKIVEIAGSFHYTIQESLEHNEIVSHPVKAPKGQYWEARLVTVWKFVRTHKGWKTATRYCGSHLDSIVRWPHAYHICDYPAGSRPESHCRDWKYVLPSGGAGSGGSVTPPSSGPAPPLSGQCATMWPDNGPPRGAQGAGPGLSR
ncbi:hypothetical protein [Nonomuraea sp. NPDC005692]|uniref:hypothetical protein n=1 Tax=Nonomuraea sp. NPDC005692 TaxID=3157168 RepID=UPI00341070C8